MEAVGDDGHGSLLGAHLHGDEEQEVGKEADEGLHEHAVPVGDGGGEYEQYELEFEAAEHTCAKFEGEAPVESGAALGVEGGYLGIHLADTVGVRLCIMAQTGSDEGPMAKETEQTQGQPVAVADKEEVDAQQTEDRGQKEHEGEGPRERMSVAYEEESYAEEPEAEVGEDVHHGIENDAAGRPCPSDVGCEFHDAVGFASQQSYGCHSIEGIAGDGVFQYAPETDTGCLAVAEDGSPGEGIHHVDGNP